MFFISPNGIDGIQKVGFSLIDKPPFLGDEEGGELVGGALWVGLMGAEMGWDGMDVSCVVFGGDVEM